MADFEKIKKANLARGSSMDNAIVFDDFKVMNDDGVRYPEEPLRHKILDIIGDLYLSGYPVIGEVTAYKSGHSLNHKMLTALLQNPQAYEIVDFSAGESVVVDGFYTPGFAETVV